MYFRLNETDGSLHKTQDIELSPHVSEYGGEIALSPDGKFVYASSRGSGIILVYKITDKDDLLKVQEFYLGGTWPRHFAIKDDLMVVVDQKGDSVQLVLIDKDTGLLTAGDMIGVEKAPAFAGFLGSM